jgi:hypothetical protein
VTSIYLQGIDSAEIIDAVHSRRAPMIPRRRLATALNAAAARRPTRGSRWEPNAGSGSAVPPCSPRSFARVSSISQKSPARDPERPVRVWDIGEERLTWRTTSLWGTTGCQRARQISV